MKSWAETIRAVKDEIKNEGYIDVGDGAEIRLGCTRSMLDAVILHMIVGKGWQYKAEEVNRDGVVTRTYVLRKGDSK